MSAVNAVTASSLPTPPPLPVAADTSLGTPLPPDASTAALTTAPTLSSTATTAAATSSYPGYTAVAGSSTATATAQAALSAMGVNPPSQVGSIVQNAAIFGGIGLALGLGVSLLPGIGPIVGVLAGAAGAVIGAIKGASDYSNNQAIYSQQLAWAQQQLATRGTLNATGVTDGSGVGVPVSTSAPKAISTVVDSMMTTLDTDADGKIVVADAPADVQRLLAYVDSTTAGTGRSDGIVTAADLKAAMSGFDVNSDGIFDGTDLQVLIATVQASDAPVVKVVAADPGTPVAATDPATTGSTSTATTTGATTVAPPTTLTTTSTAPTLTGL